MRVILYQKTPKDFQLYRENENSSNGFLKLCTKSYFLPQIPQIYSVKSVKSVVGFHSVICGAKFLYYPHFELHSWRGVEYVIEKKYSGTQRAQGQVQQLPGQLPDIR